MEKQRSSSKIFRDQFDPFQIEKDEHDFKKGLEPDPIFQTSAKVEKQRPGSKPIWDQFGPFRNE